MVLLEMVACLMYFAWFVFFMAYSQFMMLVLYEHCVVTLSRPCEQEIPLLNVLGHSFDKVNKGKIPSWDFVHSVTMSLCFPCQLPSICINVVE